MSLIIEDGLENLLAGYAQGRLAAPLSVLVESHLEISPANRRFVAGLESLSGRALDAVTPVPLSRRDERLAAIFDLDDIAPVSVLSRGAKTRLPEALCRFVGHDIDSMPWKTRLPGFKEYKLGEFDGMKASMLWIRAGQKMPQHTHDGGEVTLVCEGAFSDEGGYFGRGDISINDSSDDHTPIAADIGDCICFAVTDAPLRLTGRFGRLLNPFIRN